MAEPDSGQRQAGLRPVDTAARVARKVFERRGNRSQAHLYEGEVASYVEVGIRLDRQMRHQVLVAAVRAAAAVLRIRRDRLGRLDPLAPEDYAAVEALRALAVQYKAPGALDYMDQCAGVLLRILELMEDPA